MCWKRSLATSRTSTTGRRRGCRGRRCGAWRRGRPSPSRAAGPRKRRGPAMDATRDLFDLSGRHALVTGASRGIGLAIARALGKRGASAAKGSIVFISSVAGLDPLPGLGAYSISKAGLLGLTRVLARELGPRGVRVNAIAPGLIETRFSSALFADRQAYDTFIRRTPL